MLRGPQKFASLGRDRGHSPIRKKLPCHPAKRHKSPGRSQLSGRTSRGGTGLAEGESEARAIADRRRKTRGRVNNGKVEWPETKRKARACASSSSPPWSSHKAAQHGQRRGSLRKRACIYTYTHTYIHTRVCTHAYTVVSFERKMERDSWAAMQVLWKEEEREREGGRQKAKGRERSGKSAKEEEQRQRFSSLKKVSFGLAFCHPLLTSVQPFSGKFSNVCHPLRPFLLHGQCLSDRSPRQSHGNRDGFTVAGNPCRIYRLHSSGYVFLYLPFRISSAPSPSLRQLQQGGALSRTTACTSSLSTLLASCYEDIFFFLLFFFFFSGRIFKARWKTFSSRTLNFTNE